MVALIKAAFLIGWCREFGSLTKLYEVVRSDLTVIEPGLHLAENYGNGSSANGDNGSSGDLENGFAGNNRKSDKGSNNGTGSDDANGNIMKDQGSNGSNEGASPKMKGSSLYLDYQTHSLVHIT